MNKRLLVNKAQCLKCLDILESRFLYDYKRCSCGNLSVDGGLDYIKRGYHFGEESWKDLCEFEEEKPKVMIGQKWRLKVGMLGNKAGVDGYVFEEYPSLNGTGIQIIFPNGNYDGFSPAEQENFLEFVETVPKYTSYNFRNVMQVSDDFRMGYWKFD